MISNMEVAMMANAFSYGAIWRTQFEIMALSYVADDNFKCPLPTRET